MRRRVFPLAAGLLVALAVAVTMFSPDRGGQTAAFTFGPCDIRAASLQCTELDSGAVAVITEVPTIDNGRIVVFDPGGPGTDLRASIDVLGSLGDTETVVLSFIEPWTMDGVSEHCKAAAETYLAVMRQATAYDLPPLTLDLGRDCPEEVADAEMFVQERIDVLRDLIRQAPDSQVKYLGWSFGSVRLAALSDRMTIDGALLVSPIAHDQPWPTMMVNRAARSRELLGEVGVDVTVVNDGSISMDGRSTDLTPFDVAAGEYGSVYDIPKNQSWLSNAIDAYRNGNADTQALVQLAHAADNIQGRYGVDSLYPGIIGYWAEFCQSLTKGTEPTIKPNDDIAWFLLSFHQPCDTVEPRPKQATINADVSCLVVGSTDPLTVGVGAAGWRRPPTMVTVPNAGHILAIDQHQINDLVKEFTSTYGYPCEI